MLRVDARFSQLYFGPSLNTLQRGLPAIADLLVLILLDLLVKYKETYLNALYTLFCSDNTKVRVSGAAYHTYGTSGVVRNLQ